MPKPRTYKVTSAATSTLTVDEVTDEIVRDLLTVKPDATAEQIARVREIVKAK